MCCMNIQEESHSKCAKNREHRQTLHIYLNSAKRLKDIHTRRTKHILCSCMNMHKYQAYLETPEIGSTFSLAGWCPSEHASRSLIWSHPQYQNQYVSIDVLPKARKGSRGPLREVQSADQNIGDIPSIHIFMHVHKHPFKTHGKARVFYFGCHFLEQD